MIHNAIYALRYLVSHTVQIGESNKCLKSYCHIISDALLHISTHHKMSTLLLVPRLFHIYL